MHARTEKCRRTQRIHWAFSVLGLQSNTSCLKSPSSGERRAGHVLPSNAARGHQGSASRNTVAPLPKLDVRNTLAQFPLIDTHGDSITTLTVNVANTLPRISRLN